MKKTAIITLTYNQLECATKPFLNSLYKFTDKDLFDFYIVDNGSTDDTVTYLKNFQKENNNISIICNKENEGYSKGNNIGIKQALEQENYEYICLLNNDILFTENWLTDLVKTFDAEKSVGLVSPRINDKCKLTVKNYLNGYKKFLTKFKNEYREVVTPYFCCVLIKREVLDKIGLFDENYTPAYFEDNDLSFRAMYAGYKCLYNNRIFVYHNHSTSCNSLKSRDDIFEKNRKYFYEKHPLGKYVFEHKRTNLIKDVKRYIDQSFE